MTENQKLYFSEPQNIDALNRPIYDGDDDRGGMVLITILMAAMSGGVVGGLLVYFLMG